MIISASRRTDIPRYHSEWMVNRIREGFVDVRNPMFPTQVSRYSLDPAKVDGIVFWTKDPEPMLDKLHFFDDYSYYFQFTLTPYGSEIEPGLREKRQVVSTFKYLARTLGSNRVVWRYDPILISECYPLEFHLKAFKTMADELQGFTRLVVISFIDDYSVDGRSVFSTVGTNGVSFDAQHKLAEYFAKTAREKGMVVSTCGELTNLSKHGIEHGRCVNSRLFEELADCKLSRLKTRYEELGKDKSQRAECGCVDSIDIGWPNTCANGCRYCYATASKAAVKATMTQCDAHSTILSGAVDPTQDNVKDHRGTGDAKDRSYRFQSCYGQESLLF